MSELVIRRETRFWQDRFRSYLVVVDGVERARIARGAEVRIPLAAGPHRVELKVDWCSSPPLTIAVGADRPIRLECGSKATPFTAAKLVSTSPDTYLWLREVET